SGITGFGMLNVAMKGAMEDSRGIAEGEDDRDGSRDGVCAAEGRVLMYGLLSDMRVVEGAAFIAAPLCGLYLRQMGAEIIRFDQIGGGPDFRRWPRDGRDGPSL